MVQHDAGEALCWCYDTGNAQAACEPSVALLQDHCQSPAYASRNARKWAAVTASPALARLARHHPLEGGGTAPPPEGPFSRLCGQGGPGAVARAQRAALRLPSSQLAHVAALLPGYHFVHVPGQLYLE